jgi:hypothetical protein
MAVKMNQYKTGRGQGRHVPSWDDISNSRTIDQIGLNQSHKEKRDIEMRRTGIGSFLLSLRSMALSALCPIAVAATYSIRRRLIKITSQVDPCIFRGNTDKKALIVMA